MDPIYTTHLGGMDMIALKSDFNFFHRSYRELPWYMLVF